MAHIGIRISDYKDACQPASTGMSCLGGFVERCSVLAILLRQEEFILEYMNMPGTIGFYRPWVWGLNGVQKGSVCFLGCANPCLELDHLSNEKNPGWLCYIGDYTTHLYGDYHKPLERSLLNNQDGSWKVGPLFFFLAQMS